MNQPAPYRHEIKYATDPTAMPQILAWVRLHPAAFRQAHPSRQVNSLYLDTPTWSSLDDNLAGVAERSKLRLRWYGPIDGSIAGGVLEHKIRRGELGAKLTCGVEGTIGLDDRRWSEFLPLLRKRVCGPLSVALAARSEPVVIVHYQRRYFVSWDGRVRLTIDTSIGALGQNMRLTPNLDHPTPLEATAVVELKCAAQHRRALVAATSSIRLPRVAHSKYAQAVLAMLGRAEPTSGALGGLHRVALPAGEHCPLQLAA